MAIEENRLPAERELVQAFDAVLELQPNWEWQNTPAMQQRGELVRNTCVQALRTLLEGFDRSVTEGIAVEGSDGVGRKARVPWIRLFSAAHSPSATKGWYLVFLFCGDGSGLYLSLNQGTTDPQAGFRTRHPEYLRERVDWGRGELRAQGVRVDGLLGEIDLRDPGRLSANYEAANLAAIYYPQGSIPEGEQVREDVDELLQGLRVLYTAEEKLSGMPDGYGPGEALDGFSAPALFTSQAIAEVPNAAGVHVFWDRESALLYVGESTKQRDRLRQHLSGDRTSSILREKVGRILEQDLGRSATDDEITTFLNEGTFAWRAIQQPSTLKARVMDELRPLLNDVRPVIKRGDTSVLAVYVGQRAERNFQVGLETRTWGFPADRDDYRSVEEGDWILLAAGFTGGSPRTNPDEWRSHALDRAILGRITKAPFVDHTPHWPDERLGEASYPNRVQFEVVDNVAPLPLDDADVISVEVAEALRLSGINRGAGYVVPAAGSLFTGVIEPLPEPAVLDLQRVCSEFSGALTEANLHFGAQHLDFVRSFVVSLATKGFALLTGLSGSGKTRIAIAFGQWLGDDRYKVIAVRPDWTGPEPLLGYEDALLPPKDARRAWEAPDVLRFILRAARDPGYPYLLVLDEMNLAHVERYFADLLSGIESGEEVLPNLFEDSDGYWRTAQSEPRALPVPSNLLIVGTVNVDETTYMFSPKVLDRANTLEFRVASLDLRVDALPPSRPAAGDDALVRGFLMISTDRTFQSSNPASSRDMLAEKFRELHGALYKYGLEFGHRVFSEAMRFASLLEAAGETNQWRALDLQVMQKILPRMHGTARRLTAPLTLVGQFCLDLSITDGTTAPDFDGDPSTTPALPDSFDKVSRMMRSLRANQFASFSE